MSIADRISSMASNLSSAYGKIAYLGVDLSEVDKNMQNLSTVLDTIYNDYPKVSDEGISPSLSGTKVGRLSSTLKGNTSQDDVPTPNSPVDINVVKGTNSITLCGKNLIDFENPIALESNGITATLDNTTGEIKLNGTSTARAFISFRIPIIPIGEIISLSANNPVANTDVRMRLYKQGDVMSDITFGEINKKYENFANDKLYTQFQIIVANNTTLSNFVLYPQVELNSSATIFEIGKHFITLPIGLPVQNLLPTDENAWEQGTISGTTGANQDSTTRIRTIDYYPIKNDTDYYVSVQDTNYCFLNIILYDTSKNCVGAYYTISTLISGATSLKINIPSSIIPNVAYMRVTLRKAAGATSDTILPSEVSIIKPMIELGDKPNRYTPYGIPPMELCKIGEYQDYIYRENGNWYKYNAVGKLVLNGSETSNDIGGWRKSTTTDMDRFILDLATRNVYVEQYQNSLCNYFTTITSVNQYAIGNWRNNVTYQLVFNFAEYGTTTLDQFKTWLSTHNIVLYQPLITPTITQITDTTLISQLNALYNAMSYSGETNILQTNADNPFIISASALKAS